MPEPGGEDEEWDEESEELGDVDKGLWGRAGKGRGVVWAYQVLRHLVVAVTVLLIDKLDADGVGVLEAGIELGDHRAA